MFQAFKDKDILILIFQKLVEFVFCLSGTSAPVERIFLIMKDMWSDQGCGSGYFSTVSASAPASTPSASASASTNKNEKTTVDNFFKFYGSVACFLLHFIILRRQKSSFIALTHPTSIELIVPSYSVFLFL